MGGVTGREAVQPANGKPLQRAYDVRHPYGSRGGRPVDTVTAPSRFATPEDCERAFYEAFREGDLDGMEAVWDADTEAAVVCVHPARAPLSGRRAVMQSWSDILTATGGVHVQFDCHSRVQAGGLAVHMGLEVVGASDDNRSLVTVTNVYGLTGSGWKLHAHHAAPIHQGSGPRGPLH